MERFFGILWIIFDVPEKFLVSSRGSKATTNYERFEVLILNNVQVSLECFFLTLLTIQKCWDACGLFNVEKDYRKELLRIAQTIQASSQLNRRMPTKGLQIQYLNNFKLIFWTFVMVCIILNGERCNIISIAIRILSDVL